jgi:hypothetical protein
MSHLPNDTLPVNRLPTELLCKIFEYVRDQTVDAFTISYVCRRWRETTISYSQLWSYISISPLAPNFYEICIQRSLTALLDTIIVIPSKYLDRADAGRINASLKLVAANSERMRKVELNFPTGAVHLLDVLDVPAPRLEKFVCSCAELENKPREGLGMPALSPGHKLPTLFRGHTPNLRSLQLSGVGDSVLENFANLTSLSLGFAREDGEDCLRFYNLLRRCPLLQSLELRSYLLYFIPDFGVPIPLIALTELKVWHANARYVLSNTDTPELSTLHIQKPPPVADADEIICSFALPDDLSRLVILQKLNKLSINTIGVGFSIEGVGGNDAVNFLLEHAWAFPVCFDHLSRAQLSHLIELRVSCGEFTLEVDTLQRFFTNMPSLKILRIERVASSSFLKPLLDIVMCPQLETVVVAITPAKVCEVFDLVKVIVTSRAGVFGTNIRVGHTVEIDGEEVAKGSGKQSVSEEWTRLCNENQIEGL